MKAYQTFSTRKTPQSEPIPGKAMVENSAGGFTFQIDDWVRLDRFLILGTEGGTYYVGEREITKQNAECVVRCIKADGPRTVKRIVEISEAGRAPKNDPALFALAMCTGLGDEATKRLAMLELPKVARIGTHLFHFVAFAEQFRGWGRILSNGVKNWYASFDAESLAYQMVKYQSRDGWSHRDLLRLSHVKAKDECRNAVYHWAVKGVAGEAVPRPIDGFEQAKKATDGKQIGCLIRNYDLPRECIPTQFLTDVGVWEALLEKMPMTAMIRNLATMTRVGLLAPMSQAVGTVTAALANSEAIHKTRVHPIAVLAALKTYAQGHGERGQNTWMPVPQIIDALDSAFYLAFKNVEPTGKRFYLGIDVSGSMSWESSIISGIPGLHARVAAGAMAMVTARTEPNYYVAAFSGAMAQLPMSTKQRLDDVCAMMDRQSAGPTDCALPMLDAVEKKIPVDVFVIYTDNETWCGGIHPCQALQDYRQKMGIAAKLIVVCMTATQFSIADPNDGGMLDVVGFDTATPAVMRDFASPVTEVG